MSNETKSDKPAPPKTENDTGSPGQIGAASTADVVHQVQPDGVDGPLKMQEPKPTTSVQLMPPDIGGGG